MRKAPHTVSYYLCDDVFYEHEQLLLDMLYEAAKNMQ